MKATPFLFVAAVASLLGSSCSSTNRSFDTEADAAVEAGKRPSVDSPTGADGSANVGNKESDSGGEKPDPSPPDGGDLRDASLMTPVEQNDAGVAPDAAAPPTCEKDFDCDDGVDCTVDECTEAGCTHSTDDTACNEAPDGQCDAENGCQYATCTAETCSAGGCQKAQCVNDVCVRESLCEDDESCCAGSCVPAGCSDGVSCTDDRCGADGCEHTAVDAQCYDRNTCTTDICHPTNGCQSTNNDNPCDDGLFCNGADQCADGECSQHEGEPCAGNSQCEEDQNTCSGCATTQDCPDPVVGEWSDCDFGDEICAETGSESRTITSYTCSGDGSCTPEEQEELRECVRQTDGLECADTKFGNYTGCEYENTCSTAGERKRDRTDFVCGDGVCGEKSSVETDVCTRVTQGDSCGLCSACDGEGSCSAVPADDPECGVVECPASTECREYEGNITTNRCKALNQCMTSSDCDYRNAEQGTPCGLNKALECDGQGRCGSPGVMCPEKDCFTGACCYNSGKPACGEKCEPANTLSCDERADCGEGEGCCGTYIREREAFGSACSTSCKSTNSETKIWLCKTKEDCPAGFACKTDASGWGQGYCEAPDVIVKPFPVIGPVLAQ